MTDETIGTPTRQLPLNVSEAQNVSGRYATNYTIQFLDHELIICFFEAKPSIFTGTPEEIQEQLTRAETMPAECIARILMSPFRAHELAGALFNAAQAQSQLANEQFQRRAEELRAGEQNNGGE